MPVTVTHDLFAIVIALRAALLADPELAALLGGGDQVWREEPTTQIRLPALVILLGNRDPRHPDQASGLWWPELRVVALSDGPDDGQRLHGYLEQAWQIPRVRREAVESEWLRLDQLYPFSTIIDEGRVALQATGQHVHASTVWWKSRVCLRRTA